MGSSQLCTKVSQYLQFNDRVSIFSSTQPGKLAVGGTRGRARGGGGSFELPAESLVAARRDYIVARTRKSRATTGMTRPKEEQI